MWCSWCWQKQCAGSLRDHFEQCGNRERVMGKGPEPGVSVPVGPWSVGWEQWRQPRSHGAGWGVAAREQCEVARGC